MRAKTTLLLMAAVMGCKGEVTPPVAETSYSLGEEVVAAFAAAYDPPIKLSEIGVLAGSWSDIEDHDIASAVEKYAKESGSIVECSDALLFVCGSDRPVEGVFQFLGEAPVPMGSPSEIWVHYSATTSRHLLVVELKRLETGGWRVGTGQSRGTLW
ncbi:MAG: hypothetical protein OXK77_08735 [Gemmatimonadota bacterium]|nr:hypothetical protein [Gemmatimonadota bacterium]